MGTQEIVDMVIKLDPVERFNIVESILQSLDKPDPVIERAWSEEAVRRVQAIKEGRLGSVSLEEALGDD